MVASENTRPTTYIYTCVSTSMRAHGRPTVIDCPAAQAPCYSLLGVPFLGPHCLFKEEVIVRNFKQDVNVMLTVFSTMPFIVDPFSTMLQPTPLRTAFAQRCHTHLISLNLAKMASCAPASSFCSNAYRLTIAFDCFR